MTPQLKEDHHGVIPYQAQSLYDAEDSLLALLNSADDIDPVIELEFREDLALQLQRTIQKRDRVGAFIKQCEASAEFAKAEVKRLQARQRVFSNVAERLKGYVLGVIESLGSDDKGKLRKLNGERFTFAARACPPSLSVTDAGKIPLTYKTVTVEMTAIQYETLKTSFLLSLSAPRDFDFAALPHTYGIDNALLKADITKRQETIPGAELIVGKNSLQIL